MSPTTITRTTVKQSFIKALRSGQYEQCKDVLINAQGQRCAMGVFHADNGDPDINDMTVSNQMSPRVFGQIAILNDAGRTFNEIADILEAGLSDDLQSLCQK